MKFHIEIIGIHFSANTSFCLSFETGDPPLICGTQEVVLKDPLGKCTPRYIQEDALRKDLQEEVFGEETQDETLESGFCQTNEKTPTGEILHS